MKSIETSAINWDIIIKDKKDDESKENNVNYYISIDRKVNLIFICILCFIFGYII